MVVARFLSRGIDDNDTTSKGSCHSSVLKFKWCQPQIDFILLSLMLYAIVMLLWKGGCDSRRRKTTGLSKSKESEYRRLLMALPYPQTPPEKHEQVPMKGRDSSASTLVDPFRRVNSFDNSLVSKDDSFKRMAVPEPVLKRKGSNPSTSGLPAQPLQLNPTIRLHDKESPLLPPASPPPAYVRIPRGKFY